MAKKATNKKENLPMEEVLWKACDALRGSINNTFAGTTIIAIFAPT